MVLMALIVVYDWKSALRIKEMGRMIIISGSVTPNVNHIKSDILIKPFYLLVPVN